MSTVVFPQSDTATIGIIVLVPFGHCIGGAITLNAKSGRHARHSAPDLGAADETIIIAFSVLGRRAPKAADNRRERSSEHEECRKELHGEIY